MVKGKNNIILKTSDEIEIMAESGKRLYRMYKYLEQFIKPGITTAELDDIAEQYILQHGGIPAFKGYQGFPATLCISINEEVVHGIPSKTRVIKDGDIVSIDSGVLYKDYYSDSAHTYIVGEVDSEKRKLVEVTKKALEKGIEKARVGNKIADISKAIEEYVLSNNFSIVKNYVGHGIGRNLHECPEVPNFYTPSANKIIEEGLVIAIEPMVNMGTSNVKVLKNKWTVVTKDKKPSAHFEHTVAITRDGYKILTLE